MSLPVSSQQDLYNLVMSAIQDNAPELTDTSEGSMLDVIAGAFSIGGSELSRLIISLFNKTFIELAEGPDVTGGPDDLQTLAVDHFGTAFSRPQAVAAIDTATFSRASNSAGQVIIPAGTIVKTAVDANGNAQRYSTNADCTLTSGGSTDLSVSVGITAVVAGAAGSAKAGTITIIESTLLDSTITVTNTGNSTGADAQDTPTYRETIRNLIQALSGATKAAIEAKAKTVSGVQTATAIESALTVKQWSNGAAVGSSFNIVQANLYIGDSTGTASASLIKSVRDAIDPTVKACGVRINVLAATAQSVNWTASFTLNPSGPNYPTLNSDSSQITDSMKNYINALAVGTSFIRSDANAAILAIWGPSGTNDLTAFTTSVPVADVSAGATTKLVAGTIAVV